MMKDVVGYEGLYGVTEDGSVYSLLTGQGRRKRKLVDYSNATGYRKVNLYKDGKCKKTYVHRIVASAFVPNPENLPVVNHINANRSDNRADNLEWCTTKQNAQHCISLGRKPRSLQVTATFPDGHTESYLNLKTTGRVIFDRPYLLNWHWKRKGHHFTFRGIEFEVSSSAV